MATLFPFILFVINLVLCLAYSAERMLKIVSDLTELYPTLGTTLFETSELAWIDDDEGAIPTGVL